MFLFRLWNYLTTKKLWPHQCCTILWRNITPGVKYILQPSKSESVLIETLWLKKSWHRNPINQFWSLFFWLWKNTAFLCNWSRHASFSFMYSATRIQLDVDLWNFLIILAEISSSTLLLQISKSQLFFQFEL